MAPKEGVKPILFDFDDNEPSTANAGDNINEDSKENEKKIDIFASPKKSRDYALEYSNFQSWNSSF